MSDSREAVARDVWGMIADIFFSDETHDQFHEACGAIDVSPPVLKLLMRLRAGEPRPMRSFADELRCDASWVTSMVDDLEDRGFVERQVLPGDRRVKTVLLTGAGAKAQQRALDELHEPSPRLDALTVDELRTLRSLLEKITDQSDVAVA
jgi:DNA-binding MarR family transcriptional regulator